MISEPIVGVLVWQLVKPHVRGSLATACAVEDADGLFTLWIELRQDAVTPAGAYDSGPYETAALDREAAQWLDVFRTEGWVKPETPVCSLSEADR